MNYITAALKDKDKKVVDAFVDQKPAEGHFLSTDGVSLRRYVPMAGEAKIAVWRGSKIVVLKQTTRTDNSIVRYLNKIARYFLVFEYKGDGLELKINHLNYHHGQHDYEILAYTPWNKQLVGAISYSLFQNQVYIDKVEVRPEYRRSGIATMMYEKIAEDTKTKIKDFNSSGLTPDGSALRKSFPQY